MKYVVHWQRITYSGFENPEEVKDMDPFEMEADSLAQAKEMAVAKVNLICRQRQSAQTGVKQIPRINRLVAEDGKVTIVYPRVRLEEHRLVKIQEDVGK